MDRLLAALVKLREQLPSDGEMDALDPTRDPLIGLRVPCSMSFADARELRNAIDAAKSDPA